MKGKKILVLAPHTDDETLGCGGYIHRYSKENEIAVLAFSNCNNEDIILEFREAIVTMGVKLCGLSHFSVRKFKENRQFILDQMIKKREEFKPDIVLCPSRFDIHQDHQVIHEEAKRAFKFSTILGYELPWNNLSFETSMFVELSAADVAAKKIAVACYKSQSHRKYCSAEFIESLAIVRGVQSNKKYAEAFEVIRMIHE